MKNEKNIEIPLYKSLYSLTLMIFDMTKHLNREYKYSTGERLKKKSIKALESIILIYYNKNNKIKYLEKCKKNVETIKVIIRILKDIKQISLNKFIEMNEEIENISKQITGWTNFLNKNKIQC